MFFIEKKTHWLQTYAENHYFYATATKLIIKENDSEKFTKGLHFLVKESTVFENYLWW